MTPPRLYEMRVLVNGTRNDVVGWSEDIAQRLPEENFEGMQITMVASRWDIQPRYEIGSLDHLAEASHTQPSG